jgi:hypothetical protein
MFHKPATEEEIIVIFKTTSLKTEPMLNDDFNYNADYINTIAACCHNANKLICEANGDYSQKTWEFASKDIQSNARLGVSYSLANPEATPEDQHNNWCKDKVNAGWVFGDQKDQDAMTHPCLVPYQSLPEFQKDKDRMFIAMVNLLSGRIISEKTKAPEKIRIKCSMAEIRQYGNAGGMKVTLMPVIGQSDDNIKIWPSSVPLGKVELDLSVENPGFTLGTYYVDFTKID